MLRARNATPRDGAPTMIDLLFHWLFPLTGGVSIAAGLAALVTPKGSLPHRRVGRVGCGAVLLTAAGVIWTGLGANDYPTLLLGMLSGYLVISGYRALYLKQPAPKGTFGPTRAGALDKGMAQFLLVASCAISAWGMMGLPLDLSALAMVPAEPLAMIVLGLLAAMMALRDMRRFRARQLAANDWLIIHVTRMGGGLMITGILLGAAWLDMLPEVARWGTPAIAGALLLGFIVTRLKRRLAREGDPRSYFDIRIAESDDPAE